MPALLNLVTAFNCSSVFFLAFLIYARRREANKEANFWLAIFLFALGLMFLDDCFIQSNIYRAFPWLLGVPDPAIYAIAPSFYLSLLYFTSPKRRNSRWDLLHFLPLIILVLIEIPFYIKDSQYKLDLINKQEREEMTASSFFLIYLSIVITYILIYLVLCFIKLNKHQKNIKLFSASVETINLTWFRYFLFGIVVMLFLWIAASLLRLDFFLTYSPVGDFVIIYFLGYYAMGQPAIFPFTEQEKLEISEIMEEESQPTALDKRKMFSDAALMELKTRLAHLMKTERPYLDNELKLPKLAKMMRLNTHEMSYLLNEGFQENFFQFVNRYRIEESKRLLTNPETYALHSMVGIAFEAGFNSKTTFNTAFKKSTGFSPSEYQKMSLERELA